MLKHVMLITFGPEGPELDSWACAPWPELTIEEMAVYRVMVDGNFPKEMQQLIADADGMRIRSRFQTNAKMVVLDDETEGITTREEMERYLKYLPKDKLIELCKA